MRVAPGATGAGVGAGFALPVRLGFGNGAGSLSPAARASGLVQSALLAVGFGRAAARAAADAPLQRRALAGGIRHHRRAELQRFASAGRAGVDAAGNLRRLRGRWRQARRRLGRVCAPATWATRSKAVESITRRKAAGRSTADS